MSYNTRLHEAKDAIYNAALSYLRRLDGVTSIQETSPGSRARFIYRDVSLYLQAELVYGSSRVFANNAKLVIDAGFVNVNRCITHIALDKNDEITFERFKKRLDKLIAKRDEEAEAAHRQDLLAAKHRRNINTAGAMIDELQVKKLVDMADKFSRVRPTKYGKVEFTIDVAPEDAERVASLLKEMGYVGKDHV